MSTNRATTISQAVPTATRAMVPAGATLALALLIFIFSAQARAMPDAMPHLGVTFAYSDEALPGEGRPPSPGPTDPDGAW
jgi:hypothetical protein